MLTVRYKGHKPKVPVNLPVGAKRLSQIKETRFAQPYIDLPEADALRLVELDPHNFELASSEVMPKQGLVILEPKRKAGRPKKGANAGQ